MSSIEQLFKRNARRCACASATEETLVKRLSSNDSRLAVLKLKDYSGDFSEQALKRIIDALSTNTSVQVLYIQSQANMTDDVLDHLMLMLSSSRNKTSSNPVWALNIGESGRIHCDEWWRMCTRLPKTAICFMFAECNSLPNGCKPEMKGHLRTNRRHCQLWNLRENPGNAGVVHQTQLMWYQPASMDVNKQGLHLRLLLATSWLPDTCLWCDPPVLWQVTR